MDISSLDDIWQETLGLDDFDAGRLETAINRNQRPAYGLTLVAHPLRGFCSAMPPVLSPVEGPVLTVGGVSDAEGPDQPPRGATVPPRAAIVARFSAAVLSQLHLAWEQALPCSFLPEEILHFTIYSLRRSCPEPFSPAELEELWNRLASELQPILEATPAFAISLRGLAVTADGAILIGVDDRPVLRRLRRAVEAIPGVSPPRSYPPHVTIGQVLAPCGSAEGFQQTMSYLRVWQDVSVGELSVPALKLIHYSSRLLATVERVAEFTLGLSSISETAVHKSY
jgi:2'-5' RNA ligase